MDIDKIIKEVNKNYVPRDPDRIQLIMLLINEIWQQHPDLRFGQLVELFLKYLNTEDMFYVEDDVFKETLEKILLTSQRQNDII